MKEFLLTRLRHAPHLHGPLSTEGIMNRVLLALLPVVGLALYKYGLAALAILVVATLGAWACERIALGNQPAGTSSAMITGVLLALTLPPTFPLWMTLVGVAFAIFVGKAAFGGLGKNPFNPAIVGRIFLQAAFPQAMTQWGEPWAATRFSQLYPSNLAWPFLQPQWDAFSGATPLGRLKFEHQTVDLAGLYQDQFAGCIGEVSPWVILVGGVYLALSRSLDWRIPVSLLGSVALFTLALQGWVPGLPGPWWMLSAGGLMLGAVFMATDMVTSPVTPLGVWLYGVLIGALVVLIRVFGGLPEGMAFAILFANGCTPLLERFCQPRIYGGKA